MPPIGKLVKVKSYKKTLKDLFRFCKPYIFSLVIVLLLGLISTVVYTFIPVFIRDLVKSIDTDKKALVKYSVISLLLLALGIFLDAFNGIVFARVIGKMTYQIRAKSVKKINYLPLNYFDNHKIGDVLSRLTNDADSFQTYMGNMNQLIISVESIIGFSIGMFIVQWKLALIAFSGVVLSVVSLIIIMQKSQKYFKLQQNKLGMLNGFIEENYTNQNIINIFNVSNEENEKFDKINKELKKDIANANFMSFCNVPIMNAIKFVTTMFLLITSAIIIDRIVASAIIAFIASLSSSLIYLNFLQSQLQQLPQNISSFQQAFACFERLQDFSNEEEMTKDESKKFLKTTNGNVVFDNINFSYKKDVPLIKNFSLNVKSGQKVAIVGKTGAGKTTLVNLLMRFYEISSGDIKIDGVSIKDISKRNLRNLISMVLQDTWTFDGTIFENIKYNMENVKLSKVKTICKQIGVHHFIETTPKGYDTVLNEKLNISSGEKQLFTIARAMIQNNPIIILDEATSNVDTITEIKIQNAMDKLSKGRTSFVIAHRLSTIKNADVIVVVNEGQIIEQGNHTSLLKKNGYYAELYNSQFNE